MTTREMVTYIQDMLDNSLKQFGHSFSQVKTDIILEYLHEQQLKFFNERYLTGQFAERTYFINTHKQELLPFIEETTPSTVVAGDIDNTYVISWDDNKEFVEGYIDVTTTLLYSGTATEVQLKPVQGDVKRFYTNHTNTPILLEPVIHLLEGSKALIIIDEYTTPVVSEAIACVTTLYLLSKPKLLNFTDSGCLLLEEFHESIARNTALQIIQDKVITSNNKEEK